MLYVVATPIGNLEDLSPRGERILREADIIFCEDTRVTRKLLIKKEITTPCESLHQHASPQKTRRVIDLLKEGKTLAYVVDAGTPGISDPGGKLVEQIARELPEMPIVSIPGPAAATTLLSVSGLPSDQFLFLGFAPTKQGRKKFFETIYTSPRTCVFYESCHRIRKTLQELARIDGFGNRRIVIGRELTKLYEEIIRSTISRIAPEAIKEKGEFVIVVEGNQHG